ncbi:MAG: Smr/MutS family protein [Gemmatimonadetes bacterium]|nr:Smr/MutS family protein [Gemmatimonadota bacterium]
MSKRRKRRVKQDATPPPELTGVVQLVSEIPVATLDLHRYAVDPARSSVRDFLATHSRISAGSVVHVITGKSTGVLLGIVRDMLNGEVAHQVDEYAGMMGGGGWVVRLK